MKTILKFDSGKKGFSKAAFFLIILAIFFAIFSIYWLLTVF